MKIQKPEVHDKVWGKELWIANNDKYCGKILELSKGFRCSIHYHKNKDETFYILEGKVLMEVDGEKKIMNVGESIRIFQEMKHRFTGIEDSKILEISTHHEEDDSYRDVQSGEVNLDELDLEELEKVEEE